MALAGYSGTPLIKKLGIKEGLKLRLVGAPADYFRWLGADLTEWLCPAGQVPDFVHVFATTKKDFEREMKSLAAVWRRQPKLVIWVSWYKKSSGKSTDLTEDVIRGYALSNGLVDVKVCAVSEEWSGLKLVVPVKMR
jgi:hypothetical protein